ncbi:4-hydroxybenzoate polyprenyltransferase, mitochondrial [Mycena sanguinolenta]|uniref:4-hydroxybenzoate polyprenyltransferase, mitochondrial n=1 Tax=Mycena sanguinolenta TaxID=230812 RepID=A0A8H6YXD1_9AGAR|nr:4-hydroxybenzoate polyprenyltransferase, mitochondrial [Mycena sanguinolenta]
MVSKTYEFDYFRFSAIFMSPPTVAEIQACYELCRLHNNIGFWVVWLPTGESIGKLPPGKFTNLCVAWSIAMAYFSHPEISATSALLRAAFYVPLCFGVKSLIMTIDDLLDYDIDALVERTKERPLPRGAISLDRAWLFFGLQVVVGIYLAIKVLSRTALYTSMFVWPLYIIYPTCKRWTNFAPVPLGLMFNVGVFMGWSDISVDGSMNWNVLIPIYLGACLWTWTYETQVHPLLTNSASDDVRPQSVSAPSTSFCRSETLRPDVHKDKYDDVKIGINSPALLCRQYTIPICLGTAVGFWGLLVYGGILNGQGPFFYTGVASAGVVLLKELLRTDIDRPKECKAFFLTTPLIGQIILGGVVADAVINRYIEGQLKA